MGQNSQMTNPKDEIGSALLAAVLHLLKPLVRILLRHGVPHSTFAEVARWAYVEVADKHFALPGKKITDSRISVLTGLTRKEVARIRAETLPEDTESFQSYNRAARVVSAWALEYPAKGGAKRLPLEGEHSVASLVKRHSGDMPVRAVVDELLRVGAIRLGPEGDVELLNRHYLPPQGERRKLVYLGEDAGDLISTIAHNLEAAPKDTFFQRKVFYDNVPEPQVAEARAVARRLGEQTIDKLLIELSPFDRDVNPSVEGEGRMRVVTGIYYYEEAFHPDKADSPPRGADDRRDPGKS